MVDLQSQLELKVKTAVRPLSRTGTGIVCVVLIWVFTLERSRGRFGSIMLFDTHRIAAGTLGKAIAESSSAHGLRTHRGQVRHTK